MQQSSQTRKRPAPGTSPMAPQPVSLQTQPSFSQIPDTSDFGAFNFSNAFPTDQTFSDATFTDGLQGPQNMNFNTAAPPSSSTDLVRRVRGQNGQQDQWNGTNTMGGASPDEDEEDLDMKVALAKRDAQGKRKQIPPFVQKLSSFLDSGNTDLIRWSDDGRSFIVLDEAEFARTLIPELFKHNNYASFVRQLNMYGFHKTVNITDGSLRQSEKARKGVKPPSMYSHPYFRKNRPGLLWLIQKPAGKSSAKRKREGAESDDEEPGLEGRAHGDLGMAGGSDLAPMPRNEMAAVRQELKKLQQQQELISRMISHIKNQNEQFYRQATAFQALHDRHENSINAILTFLATFYNRSLEGHAGQNLVNMFNNATQGNQTHGSVVEEFGEALPTVNNQVQRYVKRPPLLLPGPSASSPYLQSGSPAADPNISRPSTTPPQASRASPGRQDARAGVPSPKKSSGHESKSASPVFKTDAPTPDVLDQVPESDQMMSLINSVNATNASNPGPTAPTFDFSSALDHYQNANGNSPLTPQQRDDMLALIANQQGSELMGNNNNALVSPKPPAMPDLNHFKQTQQQLEMLTNMQKRQDAKVQDLHRRLQPLSPTGTIPGVGDSDPVNPFDASLSDYDPNAFLNLENWNDSASGNENTELPPNPFDPNVYATDFNWDEFDDPNAMFQTNNNAQMKEEHNTPIADDGNVGKVESVSSEATTPAAHVQAIRDEDEGVGSTANGVSALDLAASNKRRRRE